MSGTTAPRGFLRVEAQSRNATRRLLISSGCALAAIVAGVLLVAVLMPPEEGQSGALNAAVIAPEPNTDDDSAPAAEPAKDTAKEEPAVAATPDPGDPDDKEEPAVADTEPQPSDKDPEEDGGTQEPAEEDPQEDDKEEPAVADTEPEPPDEDPGDQADEEPPADGQWWKTIHGKRCRIDFGDHKRLIMREGRLNRDEVTTYGPFVNQPIAARVRESMNPVLTVHHIGIHPRNQRPSLAYVTFHDGGRDIKGILPLQVSGDQLRLIPTR